MIILTELENGNLEIAIDPDYRSIYYNDNEEPAKQEIADLLNSPLNTAFGEMLESARYIGNDWHNIMPDEIGAMTDSPIIGRGAIYHPDNDQGLPDAYENVWWYPDYQISDPVEVLLRDGRVIFERAGKKVADTGAKILTWADFAPFSPCYDPAQKYGQWSGAMIDLLNRNDIPVEDRLWAFCTGVAWEQPERDKNLRLFACKCVRETPLNDDRSVWSLLTDERSIYAVAIAEKFAVGEVTKEEMAAAWDAAWAAARAAAWDAAWAAARAAAWDAARDAARDAAWAAARDAARAAARDAVWAAAWAAARDAARDAQIEIAKTFLQ